MAVTVSLYNHTAKKFGEGSWADTDTYKLMLLDSSAAFDATDTVIGDVSADEVSGNGWTVGGETLANVDVTTVTTNDGKFDADDVAVTASGGAIGAADYAAIYNDDDTDALVAWIDFGESKTADSGTQFKFTWSSSGIFTWTVT